MKKLSAWSVALVLAVPAFANEDVNKLYGTEPDAPIASQCVVQDSVAPVAVVAPAEKVVAKAEKIETAEQPKTEETVKKVKEVKETEEIKTVKEVRKVEEQPKTEEKSVVQETPDIKPEKIENPVNPQARFPHGIQLGVGMSATSGLNGFVGYNNKKFDSFWAKRFGIRFDFATMSPIKSQLNKRINKYIDDKGGVEIEDALKIDNFKLNAKHYGAMVDFYPFGDTWFLGGWRVSGGYFVGKMDLDANIYGDLKGDKIEFELDGKKYTYDGTEMKGRAMFDWKYSGPYLGTGFDFGLFAGFKLYLDAGVVFTDKTAKVDFDIPLDGLKDELGVAVVEGSAEYTQFQQAKDNALADVRKELKDYPYYPLVKLGFMYRF